MNDEALSRLIPSHKIGNDGLSWWVGQIEETASDTKGKGGWRYKVAIVGEHPKEKDLVETKKLPWATVMMPVNAPFMPGNIGGASSQLIPGCWVIGFYLDNDKTKPIIMGSIGQVPGATTVKNEVDKDDVDSRFKTGTRLEAKFAVNPDKDGDDSTSETRDLVGVLTDGTKNENGVRVDLGNKVAVIEQEDWCTETAQACKEKKLKDKIKSNLGQFLFNVQNNNGNIGDFYVDKYTGGLYKSTSKARKNINKIISIIREFIAGSKGYITKLIKDAVDKLVKFLLRPNKNGNVLTGVTEWANKMLKDLGCKMEDLYLRVAEWLTNLLMSYINQIYRAAICQVDELVNGIISKIYQLMNQLLNSILGPLQDILGAIAAPFNVIGKAINYILNLLGISCSGTDRSCDEVKEKCTTGEEKTDDDENFLDRLLDRIDNLFGDTPRDYTQYTCDEAYTGAPLTVTTVGFIGDVPKLPTDTTKEPKIIYDITDVEVEEGSAARFTVTRSGFTGIASSVKVQTLANQGSATAGTDYLAVDDILGFAPTETEKILEVQTLVDLERDDNEVFYVKLTLNSPEGNDVKTIFKKNIGVGTIVERDLKEPYDPFNPNLVDPFADINETPDIDGFPTGDGDPNPNPTFNVVANRRTVSEGEFIIYTVTTTNIPNGSILYYYLTGDNITPSDIVGNSLRGQFVIQDNEAKITVGISDDKEIEDEETLTFTLNGNGASVDVLIITDTDQSISDSDEGVGDDTSTVYETFRPPTVNTINVITDNNGGIIEIPVDDTGDAWAEPPTVFIAGEGIGATATGLLDNNGFLTEIRVKSPGFGYKKNLASDNDVRCIIDAFSILSPGRGYTSAPTILVDGEEGRAEAIVKNGLLVQVRVLDRVTTYTEFPPITIRGGGGSGARLMPSLACLDTEALSKVGSTKIGTGRYVDCP